MRHTRILFLCMIIPFLTLNTNSINNHTNAVYLIVEATNNLTTTIPTSTEVYPEGADVINRTLEEHDSYAKKYELTRSDSLQIYFMIDKSSIDLRLFFHSEEYEVTFEGLTPRTSAYKKTFAFTESGVQVSFYNPGLTAGGDSIQITGYIRVITNGAQEADQFISVPEYRPFFEGWIVIISATIIVCVRKYKRNADT
ncbi:MAG: hypothetical protein JSV04_08670 [Candidatus Heimdallarchaeota archaeon]|nr:MAG: hypothetical protein JSV04_08670 [Candidatus Heimdallarchaeota archaeon]